MSWRFEISGDSKSAMTSQRWLAIILNPSLNPQTYIFLESTTMNRITENEIMTARSTSMVLVMLTILMTFCWVIMGDSRLQAAAFLSGLAAVVTWLSYCQRKTTAEVTAIIAKNKTSH